MRVSAMSSRKKLPKNSMDNRTTKTKASATKPEVFAISMTRYKNNPTPALFNSTKKKEKNNLDFQSDRKQSKINFRSEKKSLKLQNTETNFIQQLNTKVSLDYINSLYSDLGVHMGIKLKDKLQGNKQNSLGQRNISILKLPTQGETQCLEKIKHLVNLKGQINKAYSRMKNTQTLFFYLQDRKQSQGNKQNQHYGSKKDMNYMHSRVDNFLVDYTETEKQLLSLEKQYQEMQAQIPQPQQQQDLSEQQLDTIILQLQQQIAKEKAMCLRLQKQQKFQINKLYFTQTKNNDLTNSSTNLKMQLQSNNRKNINLRDTMRLSSLSKTDQNIPSQKCQRSVSMKLMRIKRYNFLSDQTTMKENSQSKPKTMIKSHSTSSLNSTKKQSYLPLIKPNFFDKIY